MLQKKIPLVLLILLCSVAFKTEAQQKISLKEAVSLAVKNYGTINAKANYAKASAALADQASRDYLPNFNLSAQQAYGTANGQLGPQYGFGGLGVSSSGLPLPEQNWNAAFGALYLANINWDFFAFGRAREKVKTAQQAAFRDRKDWEQELFRHEVKVAGTYLNLIAAKQLTTSYRKNLARADTFRFVVVTRALNGLIAGVDSSQANAEVSNARIALTKAIDFEQEQSNLLAQLMGVPAGEFELDTFFVSRIPALIQDTVNTASHPLLQWYKSRIGFSDEQSKYFKTFYYPTLSLVGVMQTRASGFGSTYAQNQSDFSHDYWEGIHPNRSNYLLGLGLTWNLTQPLRISRQVKAQQYISKGLQDEYQLADQQVQAQLHLSALKIKNALDNYREVPVQVRAASNAYLQKSVLYKNGLTNLVEVTQSLYALIRAETDRDIAYSNVWQALLLRSAAAGDFSLFLNEL